MNWTEISIKISSKDTDIASAIANQCVPYGIYIEDYSDLEQEAVNIAHIDLIDEELIKKDRTKGIIHIYLPIEKNPAEEMEFLKNHLTKAGIEHNVKISELPESSYKDNWKKYFKKQNVGEKLLICPEWEKSKTEETLKTENNVLTKNSRKVLYINPGAAFGTGTHATTKMCLEILEDTVLPNAKVLDIGTGSGILSVASIILGAGYALGVDIDKTAVKVSRATAAINNVQNKCEFMQGDAIKDVTGKFDIIVANIVADVIIFLSDKIKPLLNENGIFICSGIIEGRENEVYNALKNSGMNAVIKKQTDNWFAFGGKYDRI